MAFVRWRGNSAELLTTLYERGRSRQVRLACLGGAYYVHPDVRATVAQRFPSTVVDWDAVDRALAEGPPHERAQAKLAPNDRLEWFGLEQRLRYWAAQTQPIRAWEADRLLAAAAVLRKWREAKPYFPHPVPAFPCDDIQHPVAVGRHAVHHHLHAPSPHRHTKG